MDREAFSRLLKTVHGRPSGAPQEDTGKSHTSRDSHLRGVKIDPPLTKELALTARHPIVIPTARKEKPEWLTETPTKVKEETKVEETTPSGRKKPSWLADKFDTSEETPLQKELTELYKLKEPDHGPDPES